MRSFKAQRSQHNMPGMKYSCYKSTLGSFLKQNFIIYCVEMQMMKIEILHISSNLIFNALSANNLHNILQAADPDEGLNADIRYQILGRMDDESRKFIIDPVTGQVRSIVSFAYDAGRVYGFDVKATDKRGADDGKSAITNVFVSVF